MKPSLQSTLKKSESTSEALAFICHKRDTLFVCQSGKIIERLDPSMLPYFINKYVGQECKHLDRTPLAGDIYAGDKDSCNDCGRSVAAV